MLIPHTTNTGEFKGIRNNQASQALLLWSKRECSEVRWAGGGTTDVEIKVPSVQNSREPVWPSGKAVGW